ncbi:MAG: hypothetical protein ACI4LA_06140 [Emergencia sp.]
MNAQLLLERLLQQYQENFDIEKNYIIDGYTYDALASFNVANARYVLVKKAELWRANCFEYILFDCAGRLDEVHFDMVMKHVREYVEPQLVRRGEKYPEKDHMYTYMTVIMLCDSGIAEEAAGKLQKTKLYINYKLAIRGYSELRLIAIDTRTGEIITNKAAKAFKKELKKLF